MDADLDGEITEDEFMRALIALSVNKAPGFDNIPGIVFILYLPTDIFYSSGGSRIL